MNQSPTYTQYDVNSVIEIVLAQVDEAGVLLGTPEANEVIDTIERHMADISKEIHERAETEEGRRITEEQQMVIAACATALRTATSFENFLGTVYINLIDFLFRSDVVPTEVPDDFATKLLEEVTL